MPYFLYRHFGKDGTLLYIGLTTDLKTRFSLQRGQAQWFQEVAQTITKVVGTNKREALAIERSTILAEQPLFNINGVVRNGPDRMKRIKKLRASGRTFQSIADEYGLTRQRVHQIVRYGK